MKFIYFLSSFFFCSQLMACLWDSDTLKDELDNDTSVYDLITGQFPHHGESYYLARLKVLTAKEELSEIEQHDLGVAYTRLGKFEEAKEVFYQLKEQEPNSYEVHSNLGVMYKKMGEFEKAYSYMEKALEIKPEGHMGLGDWYLKRIAYELKLKEHPEYELNFLGFEYSLENYGPMSCDVSSEEAFKRAKLLIHNDYLFADAYVMLGDYLRNNWDLHLAVRAYTRAKLLDHPRPQIVDAKIRMITDHWREVNQNKRTDFDTEIGELDEKFNSELAEVSKWNEEFIKVESDSVAKGMFPSLKETQVAMKRGKFYPNYPVSWSTTAKSSPFKFFALVAILCVILLYIATKVYSKMR